MTEHYPRLPEKGELVSTDRICSSSLPAPKNPKDVTRVFHEAGPVAYVGPGVAEVRCIHCAREFPQ